MYVSHNWLVLNLCMFLSVVSYLCLLIVGHQKWTPALPQVERAVLSVGANTQRDVSWTIKESVGL